MHLDTVARMAATAAIFGIWQGVILAAVVWLCLRFLSPSSASLRFAIWAGVFLVVAGLPIVEGIFSQRLAPSAISRPALLQVDERWSFGLALIWCGFSITRAVALAIQGYHLWTLHRQAIPIPLSPSLVVLSTAGRPAQLCTSTQLDRPGVVGFFFPRILIPAWLYPQLSMQELEQIVLHEREHLRRHDDWLNLAQKLSLVILPLNPILICIERLLCRERELACDDGVLRYTRSPRLYATCLATLAERGLDRAHLSLALGALGEQARQSELGRRVMRILQHKQAASPLRARALTATVAIVLAGGAFALTRCPQLVSFTAPNRSIAVLRPVSPTMDGRIPAYATAPAARLIQASLAQPRGYSHPHKARVVRRLRHHFAPSTHQTILVLSSWADVAQPRFVTLPVSFRVMRVDGGWLFVQL